MELRTYLSFSQVMVASLVLLFSLSGYRAWQPAGGIKNDEVFQITFGA